MYAQNNIIDRLRIKSDLSITKSRDRYKFNLASRGTQK